MVPGVSALRKNNHLRGKSARVIETTHSHKNDVWHTGHEAVKRSAALFTKGVAYLATTISATLIEFG